MNSAFAPHEKQAIACLNDFLPDRIFDAHAHLCDTAFLPDTFPGTRSIRDMAAYRREMGPVLGETRTLRLNMITYPDRSMGTGDSETLKQADAFLVRQLEENPANVGEILVRPGDTGEELERRLVHPGIRGFKCYHILSGEENTWNCTIDEYLPEAAWEIANRKKMCITLHMVRDLALADPENLRYIREMAAKYPDAVLILAHAARSFASWTGVESVAYVADLENVWFDFSAICESPAMLQILKKTGTSRCMWGSDYPISMMQGKAISLADGFYWIYQRDLDQFSGKTPIHSWLIGTENLMAVRQACILAELHEAEIEAIFYSNAAGLFDRRS